MKRLTKLFLLILCSGFLILGFNNAQNGMEEDSKLDNFNMSYNLKSKGGDKENISYNPNILGVPCECGMNMLDFYVRVCLFGIIILLGIMLIILSFKTISLYKKLDTYEHNRLFYFPVINLYPLSKITIGKIRFIILILFLGFFIYNVYVYKIFANKNLCCSNPIRQGYSGIIVGICSIVILGVLLSKLSYLTKSHKENSNKESSNE